jgi:hypothetical protein
VRRRVHASWVLTILARDAEGVGRWEDVDGGFGRASRDLLAALVAVPVGLLEPVEAAGQRRETDADEAEEGTSEARSHTSVSSRRGLWDGILTIACLRPSSQRVSWRGSRTSDSRRIRACR